MLRERSTVVTALALALGGCGVAALADEIWVEPSTPGGIQGAINVADPNRGDVIILRIGTYRGQGNYNLDPNGKAITIRGESSDPTLCVLELNDPNSDPNLWQYRKSGDRKSGDTIPISAEAAVGRGGGGAGRGR